MRGKGTKNTSSRANADKIVVGSGCKNPGTQFVRAHAVSATQSGKAGVAGDYVIFGSSSLVSTASDPALHASDMLAARSELGTLNLDYAEADKKMLEQAKKLQKRFR